jgi:hypothetical protein
VEALLPPDISFIIRSHPKGDSAPFDSTANIIKGKGGGGD